jgi:hypothetical protein
MNFSEYTRFLLRKRQVENVLAGGVSRLSASSPISSICVCVGEWGVGGGGEGRIFSLFWLCRLLNGCSVGTICCCLRLKRGVSEKL